MKRVYFATLFIAISMIACSFSGDKPIADTNPDVSQPSDFSQDEEGASSGDSSLAEQATQAPLPEVEAGDCGAGIGPGVNLAKCDLVGRNLSESNLSGANLAQANLSMSNLSSVDFSSANLSGVIASESNISEANFSNADLTSADLSESNLIGADFTGAITISVDFSGCNMTDAIITQEQLDQAFSITGAVLPDGSIGK
ncbi:MAG: hypothetical protein Kow002_14990 [Anaerolineales bacterium]